MAVRNWYVLVAVLAGALGLALDFYVIASVLTVSAQNPVARSVPGFLVYYLTFLTNLSNIGLLLVYVCHWTKVSWLNWFRHPVTRAGMAGIMTLVMVFYHFMLAPNYHFHGPIVWSNILLHYVTPMMFLVWWAGFTRHGALRYRDLLLMLVPGLAYVAYVLVRGVISGEYPYTILDPGFAIPGQAAQGYLGVAIGVAVLVALVAVFDLILIAADRLLARREQPT